MNNRIPGGFDSRKHPILIADAIEHARALFLSTGTSLSYGSTEVFRLGEAMYPMVASVIEEARAQQEILTITF